MTRQSVTSDNTELRQQIIRLRSERRDRKLRSKASGQKRAMLSRSERAEILAKTDGHCHICGGHIGSEKWQADHVLAFSGGGAHQLGNYLAAHELCNNYRWDYLSEEFQLILKLGVYTKTQIERGTSLGRTVSAAFAAHEVKRIRRRRNAVGEKAPSNTTL